MKRRSTQIGLFLVLASLVLWAGWALRTAPPSLNLLAGKPISASFLQPLSEKEGRMVYIYSFKGSYDGAVSAVAAELRKDRSSSVPKEKTYSRAIFQNPIKPDLAVEVYRGELLRISSSVPPALLEPAQLNPDFVTVVVSRPLKVEETVRWKLREFLEKRKWIALGDSFQVGTPAPLNSMKSYPLDERTDSLKIADQNMIFSLGQEGL